MVVILINGRKTVLKNNASFEFVSENPMFSDADEYSFNISFPLKDCPENIAVFGFINRPGANVKTHIFDMKIIAGMFSAAGAGVVTGFTDVECTVQFLGNRSAQNYYSDLDNVFVNNLELGSVPDDFVFADKVNCRTAWLGHGTEGVEVMTGYQSLDFVALPWVNENTGNIINNASSDEENASADSLTVHWVMPEEATKIKNYRHELSWSPYLIFIAERICNAIGFSFDFSEWRNSVFYHLLLCHAVPGTWNHEWATLLPHWSVIDFFRNIEPLLEGFFHFDMVNNHISFRFYNRVLDFDKKVVIDRLIDEFSSDTFDKVDSCKLISQRFMGYSFPDTKTGKLYSCDWFVRNYCSGRRIKSLPDAQKLLLISSQMNYSKYWQNATDDPLWGIYAVFLQEENCYITYRTVLTNNKIKLGTVTIDWNVPARASFMLNAFGHRCIPDDFKESDTPDMSLAFAPVIIDSADDRRMMFINPGTFDEKIQEPLLDKDENGNTIGYDVYETQPMFIIDQGYEDGSDAHFSNLAVGFYPGLTECNRQGIEILPIVDNIEVDTNWYVSKNKNHEMTLDLRKKFRDIPNVNPNVKFNFSFLSDSFPDVTDVFYIRGHNYLCEKLTATLSADGMSQLIKGVFWRIL